MSKKPIAIIGEGHGFWALARGLQGQFPNVVGLDISPDDLTALEKIGVSIQNRPLDTWVEDNPGGTVISSGFRKRVSEELLGAAEFLNIHYALFPRYRGMHSVVWAMLNGEKNTGVTLHRMSEILDEGPILWQKRIQIGQKTSKELLEECNALVERRIAGVIKRFQNRTIRERHQNFDVGFYVAKRNFEDCKVNWQSWDSEFFERALRALVPPYPQPFIELDNSYFNIISARVHRRHFREIPGHVVGHLKDSVLIFIPGGMVEIFLLEDCATKRIMSPLDLDLPIGTRLT